jgi:CubicO group peptidase (beta-lactamase class C family)
MRQRGRSDAPPRSFAGAGTITFICLHRMSIFSSSVFPGTGPHATIQSSPTPAQWTRTVRDHRDLRIEAGGRKYSLAEFMQAHCSVGVLVLHNGAIVLEEYAAQIAAETPLNGFSLAKFVLGLLTGAAVRAGELSEDAALPVGTLLPSLSGTAFGECTVAQLLEMTSGVAWMEAYRHPRSHLVSLVHTFRSEGQGATLRLLAQLPRFAEPGSVFNYSSGDVQILASVLQVVGARSLSAALTERIWLPLGMEAPARWRLGPDRMLESAWCDLYASLRDWGRLGQFGLDELTRAEPTGILPVGWVNRMRRASTKQPRFGRLAWLGAGGFGMSGLYGQSLQIFPESKRVVVLLSRWPEPTSEPRMALQSAFMDSLDGWLA